MKKKTNNNIKHNFGRVIIEEITSRMSKKCDYCEEHTVNAGKYRLKIIKGAGKWQTSKIFCADCGRKYLKDQRRVTKSLARELKGHQYND